NPAGSRNIASPMLVTMPSLVRTGPLSRYTVTSDQLKFLTLNTTSSGPYRTDATSWLGEEAHAPRSCEQQAQGESMEKMALHLTYSDNGHETTRGAGWAPREDGWGHPPNVSSQDACRDRRGVGL